jgi:replicative DNA helicase
MANNLELALLSRVIADGDFHSVQKARIDDSYFTTDIAKEVYRFLRDTYHGQGTSGLTPSFEMVAQRIPAFFPTHAPDAVPVLCQELRRQKIRTEMLLLSQNLQLQANTDPLAAIAELRVKASEIASLSEAGEDLSMSAAFHMLWNRYQMVQNAGGLLGIPYPWAVLNEETQGMQGSQFIVLYGRPKSMKSWVGFYIAVYAYLVCRRRVLIYTREMSPALVAQRVAALIGQVDYKAFKNGTLQPELRQKVFTILQELMDDEKAAGAYGQHQPCLVVTSDRSSTGAGGGVGWLQAKIRDLKPDLVIVDGMYLMKDDRTKQRTVDWKQIAHISQDLKLTCQDFDIPIIGITQANRSAQKTKGDDLTEIAYADALGQDADAVFRVNKTVKIDEATKQKRTELLISAPGIREGQLDGIVIHGEPATNFSFIRKVVNLDEETDDEYGDKKSGQNGKTYNKPKPEFYTPPIAMKGKMPT